MRCEAQIARFWLYAGGEFPRAYSRIPKPVSTGVENAGPPTVYQDLKALSWPFTQEVEEYCRISKQLQGSNVKEEGS